MAVHNKIRQNLILTITKFNGLCDVRASFVLYPVVLVTPQYSGPSTMYEIDM
jgi:hypothetical protein